MDNEDVISMKGKIVGIFVGLTFYVMLVRPVG